MRNATHKNKNIKLVILVGKMGLLLRSNDRCNALAVPKGLVRPTRFGRVALLASMALVLTVGTARSYVTHDGLRDIDLSASYNVSRETSSSFDEIIAMTAVVSSANTLGAPASSSDLRSSSTAGNLCTYSLNTQDTSYSKVPAVRTQRPVGKVAALGMLLGARFALAPRQRFADAIVDNNAGVLLGCQAVASANGAPAARSAGEVVAYRQCMKARALKQVMVLR